MAATVSLVNDRPFRLADSGMEAALMTIALDNSYPAGGYSLTGHKLGKIQWMLFGGDAGGYSFDWDRVNQKLKVMDVPTTPSHSAQVECAATTNLSAVTVVAIGVGR